MLAEAAERGQLAGVEPVWADRALGRERLVDADLAAIDRTVRGVREKLSDLAGLLQAAVELYTNAERTAARHTATQARPLEYCRWRMSARGQPL